MERFEFLKVGIGVSGDEVVWSCEGVELFDGGGEELVGLLQLAFAVVTAGVAVYVGYCELHLGLEARLVKAGKHSETVKCFEIRIKILFGVSAVNERVKTNLICIISI